MDVFEDLTFYEALDMINGIMATSATLSTPWYSRTDTLTSPGNEYLERVSRYPARYVVTEKGRRAILEFAKKYPDLLKALTQYNTSEVIDRLS